MSEDVPSAKPAADPPKPDEAPTPLSAEEAIRTRLQQLEGEVPLSDLLPHLKRDAVFVVHTRITLVDCGVSIAEDDVEQIKAWVESSDLRKPTASEREEWEKNPTETVRSLVVQPFVLVQK